MMNKLIAKIKSLFVKKPAAAKCACGNTKDVNSNCDGSHAKTSSAPSTQA